MKRSPITATVALASLSAFVTLSPAGITTFDYTQTDVSTGAGIIAAPAPSLVGGVTITWVDTPMPQAAVRDPAGAGSVGGAVGGFDTAAGGAGDNGQEVALFWDANGDIVTDKDVVTVDIIGTGSDGNPYRLPIDLVFFGDNVLPDENFPGWGNNDYRWSLDYGDILGSNPDGAPRTAIWLSPTYANVAVVNGGGGRQQRYTQNADSLVGPLVNTDTTSGAEKDAFDQNGNTTQFAAIGQPLEISFGWRDRDVVTNGPVLVDNFNFQGLLEYDEADIVVANPEAQIFSFSASPAGILPGGSATLNWAVNTAATSIDLTQDPGADIGDVAGDTDLGTGIGGRQVTPGVTTTYTLEVQTPSGTGTADATVQVALIASFATDDALIDAGQSANLSWHVREDVTVSISPDPGPINTVDGMGSISVSPDATITYTLTASAPGATEETAEVSINVLSGGGGGSFSAPIGGWDCEYGGDVDPTLLGWDHNNGSDQWDGSGIGTGNPGGASILTNDGDTFLRIQDTGDPQDYGIADPSNRKIYFTKDLTNVFSLGYSPLTDGVTMHFRTRVSTADTGPLDDHHPNGGGGITPWPALGSGYELHNDGKSVLCIRDNSTTLGSICFAPSTDSQGLTMNGGMSLTMAVLEWQEVWVTVEADTSGGGTHRADIYLNGETSPASFHLVAGTGSDEAYNYAVMGLGSTNASGAIDIDFFNLKEGIHVPASKLKITEFRRDPGTGNLRISWESKGGMKYNLRSVVDPSDPSNSEPGTWPPVVGHQEIDATPPINTVHFPYPAEDGRYFVVEEFRPPPVPVLAEENFDGGAVLPAGWTTGPNVGDTGTTLWEVGIPTHFLGPFEARSLPNCAGTNLASAYGPDTNIYLRTPPIDLTAAGAATLNYDQFTYTDQVAFQDFGTLKVLDATTNSLLAVIEARVEGASADWSTVSKQLPTEALGKTIKIEFGFIADDVNSDAGWFVDNVGVTVP
ncbi:MAG: choice-of-anchor J domain-containing protein [Roseibacillus sp.]